MSNVEECFVCGNPCDIVRHHIFPGTNGRRQSEKYGAWVWLCPYHHNMSDYGVHGKYGGELMNELKVTAQRELEKTMTREEFRQHFGRSYL